MSAAGCQGKVLRFDTQLRRKEELAASRCLRRVLKEALFVLPK